MELHKADAAEARVIICTSASVMLDQMLRGGYNTSTQRDVIIFDEADQLPQAAALRSDTTITASEQRHLGLDGGPAEMWPTWSLRRKGWTRTSRRAHA